MLTLDHSASNTMYFHIGELLDGKADLLVGDVTITYEREQGRINPFLLAAKLLYKR